MDTEIRVSTESRPSRRKFSHRSSRDSNPRPFNHESGALTTELSPPPNDGVLTIIVFIHRYSLHLSRLAALMSHVISEYEFFGKTLLSRTVFMLHFCNAAVTFTLGQAHQKCHE